MPASGEGSRSNRKGHYSCDFCRLRKLRCDRPLPCTNCVSRGKRCHFGPGGSRDVCAAAPASISTEPQQQRQQQPVASISVHPLVSVLPSLQQPQLAPPDHGALLAEIQALKKLAQDLERRVVQSTSFGQQRDADGNDGVSGTTPPSASTPSPAHSSHSHAEVIDVAPDSTVSPSSSSLGQVSEVVAHLERVSMGQSSREQILVNDLLFKVECIRDIPQAPTYTAQLGKPTRCVWLPRYDEARVLLDKFITNVSYIYHAVHHPSLRDAIDNVYRQIGGQEPIKSGHLVLLLSIVASVTYVWTPEDDVMTGASDRRSTQGSGSGPWSGSASASGPYPCSGFESLFSSSTQANAQTPLWIKSTYDVLNAITGQHYQAATLETIQGIIILSFLVCNLEGVTLRYKHLISTGLLLSRELGLHRIDHESKAATANTIQAEIGRRVWWYLVATDWLLAARYGAPGEGMCLVNPRQMMVKKPRNINDVDLLDNGHYLDLPISQPTEMSYFLQRIRLAEISRSIVDQQYNSRSAALGWSGAPPGLGKSCHAPVMAMEVELDQMIHELPSYLNLDTYDQPPGNSTDFKSSGIFIQAYMLNSIIHTQRCKLHLTYLTSSGPNNMNNPAYASSREKCLSSARRLIRAEAQLETAQHPFVLIRLRLSAILYGVFIASIVLLMDSCVDGTTGSQQEEVRRREVAEALRIIEGARSYSSAAANLHESLTQVLAKHRAQQQQQQHQTQQLLQSQPQQQQMPQAPTQTQRGTSSNPIAPVLPDLSAAAPAMYPQVAQLHQHPNPLVHATSPGQIIAGDLDSGGAGGFMVGAEDIPGHMSVAGDQPTYGNNQFAQNIEELMDLDGFQWDDLFSGIDSSSFF